MAGETFSAGVAPGGLRNIQEIKILICYIFDKLDKPLTKNDVTSILQSYEIANYFDASQAFSQMVLQGNLKVYDEDDNFYVITPTGRMISEELSGSLPVTIKEKSLKNAEGYFKRLKSEKENTVNMVKTEWGYMVNCKISGGDFNMLELGVYAPDINAASIIKDNFYKKPDEIYKNILTMLTQGEY